MLHPDKYDVDGNIYQIFHSFVTATILNREYTAYFIPYPTLEIREKLLDSGWYEIIEGLNQWTNDYLDQRDLKT